MASITFYNLYKKAQLDNPIDWDTDTIKVALVTSSYTPSASTHDFWDDVSANEVSGTNYTAGGETLSSVSVSDSSGTTTVDAADVTWTSSGSGFSNARYAIIYKDTGTASTSPLVGYIDFTSDKGNTTGDLTIEWHTDGIFTLS